MSKHPLYSVWNMMVHRCTDKKILDYKNYGGRGISVCDEWIDDPKAYIEHVTSLPDAMKKGLSIDRIDNDSDYKPGNLRWVSSSIQSMNKRHPANRSSGYQGVRRDRISKRYGAFIRVNGRELSLGYRKNVVDAVKLRNDYILKHGHPCYKVQEIKHL